MPKQLAKVSFEQLWSNHPTVAGVSEPCCKGGKPNYHNQCAIRMGVCLTRSGFDLTLIKAPSKLVFCAFHDRKEGHTLRAEQLANGLIHLDEAASPRDGGSVGLRAVMVRAMRAFGGKALAV